MLHSPLKLVYQNATFTQTRQNDTLSLNQTRHNDTRDNPTSSLLVSSLRISALSCAIPLSSPLTSPASSSDIPIHGPLSGQQGPEDR